jgi:hypothetical protein
MTRSIPFFFALAALPVPLAVGCDTSGSGAQAEVNKAQEQANKDIAKANDEANGKTLAAQAEADKKIGAVQADFAKVREDYRHEMQGNLDAINKSITELEVKAETSTGEAKATLDGTLPYLKAQRNAFANDLRAIDSASALTWDSTRARVEKEWTDLKGTADRAAG